MKSFLVIALLLMSFSAAARDIYVLKDKDGSTLFSARDESGADLKLDKVIKYDDSELKKWSISCSKDKFNGSKVCSLSKLHNAVMVNIINGKYSVYVGGNHYPRTQSVIKIDYNNPIYGYEGSSQTPQKVIEQMKNGRIAYTRYKEWPYEYNKDGEVDLIGFTEAFNQMLEEYKKL